MLIGVLGSSPTPPSVFNLHSWCFSPFRVDEGEDLLIRGVDVKGRRNWSMEQCWSLGKRTKSQLQYNDFLVRVSNPRGTKSVEINNYLDQHIYIQKF